MTRRRWKYRILSAIVPPLVSGLLKLLRVCLTIEYRNSEIVVECARRKQPTIIAFWHDEFVIGTLVGRDLVRRGVPVSVLASLSEDGELLARTARRLGMVPVRGSSTRGARSGLKAMEHVLRQGGCATIAVDGPRGPRRVAKIGAALMARDTGALILPGTVRYGAHWRVRSWDRTRIPKPFTRCMVTLHEPISVPTDADRDALERVRDRLERVLLDHCEPDLP